MMSSQRYFSVRRMHSCVRVRCTELLSFHMTHVRWLATIDVAENRQSLLIKKETLRDCDM